MVRGCANQAATPGLRRRGSLPYLAGLLFYFVPVALHCLVTLPLLSPALPLVGSWRPWCRSYSQAVRVNSFSSAGVPLAAAQRICQR